MVQKINGPTYNLNINQGTGGGLYQEGDQVLVSADTPPAGMIFSVWTGDTAFLANPNQACTTLTMPAQAVSITATYEDAPDTLIAINCGGPAHTASDGTAYGADQYSTGGSTYTTGDSISGTTDGVLFQSERYGSYSYQVPVPNGSYRVLLQFAEIYATANGVRVMDIAIEGQVVVDDLDIHATVGHDAAYEVLIPEVVVNDGQLTITTSASVNNAKLSAFRIETAGSNSDYEIWNAMHAGADLSDPNGDHDGDGVSNDAERMFGTDPTSGGSSNPIVVPLTPATGTFSYTRRDASLTGLTYTIWTSINLSNWQEDTGAVQSAGAPDANDVETVEVTLSSSLLAHKSLFIQVQAQ